MMQTILKDMNVPALLMHYAGDLAKAQQARADLMALLRHSTPYGELSAVACDSDGQNHRPYRYNAYLLDQRLLNCVVSAGIIRSPKHHGHLLGSPWPNEIDLFRAPALLPELGDLLMHGDLTTPDNEELTLFEARVIIEQIGWEPTQAAA